MSTNNLLITDRTNIRKEWNKSDADVLKDIQIIKDWIVTQKHLPEMPTNNMIEFFLTNCKYSIEKTKKNLDMYYTVRDLMPEIYRGIHPVTSENLNKIYQTGYVVTLPKLTPLLYRIHVFKYKDSDSEQAHIRNYLAHAVNNMFEIRIHEDLALGDIFVVDLKRLNIGVMSKLTPTFIKQFATVLERVHSNRLKELHFVYATTYFDAILTVFKNFLSKKLQKRIISHDSLESLFKYVPQEMLPIDFGGKEKSLQELTDLWKQKFAEYKNRFDKLENMHVDESLRPEKLKNHDLLGYHGNFRSIDVD